MDVDDIEVEQINEEGDMKSQHNVENGIIEDMRILLRLGKCSICRQYLSVNNMSRHIRESHPNRLPRSHGTKLKRKNELKVSSKIFKCTSPCNAAFFRKEHLTYHKKSHKCFFNKKYLCKFCSQMFVSEIAYWNHLNNRYCSQQFSCKVCKMHFSKRNDLVVHSKDCIMKS